jgi:hypothetical protein
MLKPPDWFKKAHLSPSSINKWIASPHAWAAAYLGGIFDPPGSAAIRGTVVEDLLVAVLTGKKTADEALQQAAPTVLERCRAAAGGGGFASRMPYGADAEAERAEAILRHCLEAAVGAAAPVFAAGGNQWRAEVDLGAGIPVIGFIDLLWPKQGKLLDLKTSARKPGKPKAAHMRQLSLYRAFAPGYSCGFAVAHPDGFTVVYPDQHELDAAFEDLKAAAQRLVRWLNRYSSAEEVLAECMPDLDGLYFPVTTAPAVRRAFGLES